MSKRLVKFEADWCGPCKQQTQIMQDASFDYESVDIDEEQDRAREENVTSIPTIIVYGEDGDEIERFTGVTQLEKLEKAME